MSITKKETETPSHDGSRSTSHKLKPHGFHPGDLYYGYHFNANYQQQYLGEFIVNSEGDLWWKIPGLHLSAVVHYTHGFLNGEQSFVVLVSEDKQKQIATIITPDPIEYVWEDSAYASVVLLEQNPWSFFFAGKGFKPNEDIVLTSIDNYIRIDYILRADANGLILSTLSPLSPNNENETATLTIKRYQSTEIPTLTYLYGRAALAKALPHKYPPIKSETSAPQHTTNPSGSIIFVN